jgi:two-component system, sensor histidine kinase
MSGQGRQGRSGHHVHPEAAVIDVGLPGIDGFEVARRIRQDPHPRFDDVMRR